MSADSICARVTAFIRDVLCAATDTDTDTDTEEITETTALLEGGLLDSLRTAKLLNFIRLEFGVTVPAGAIEFRHFRDARSVAAMVRALVAG